MNGADFMDAKAEKARGCERKKWFRNQSQAEAGLMFGQYAYNCRFCFGWHIATRKS